MQPIDVSPTDLETMRQILQQHVPEVEVRAFGSRVGWTARETSDLDLALMTDEPLPIGQMVALKAAFTNSNLPFRVDIVDWASTSESFRKVIERKCLAVWKKVEKDNIVVQENVDGSRVGTDAWISMRLGEVCTKIGSGATPRGGKDVYLQDGPYALIRSQNIHNHGFRHEGLAFIAEEHANMLRNVEVLAEDVLLNITGDSVARVCQVAPDVLPARVNQHVAIIRPDVVKLDPTYLRYFLVCPEIQAVLLSWAGSGGTRNALTKEMIESFEVPTPPLPEQRAIAHILGT